MEKLNNLYFFLVITVFIFTSNSGRVVAQEKSTSFSERINQGIQEHPEVGGGGSKTNQSKVVLQYRLDGIADSAQVSTALSGGVGGQGGNATQRKRRDFQNVPLGESNLSSTQSVLNSAIQDPEWIELSYSWKSFVPDNLVEQSQSEIDNWINAAIEILLGGAVSTSIEKIIGAATSKLVGRIGGILVSVILEIPTVGVAGFSDVTLVGNGEGIGSAIVNQEYIAWCLVNPGDEFFVPEQLFVEKKTGLFSWETVAIYDVVTEEEALDIGSNFATTYFLVLKQPISFSETGKFRVDYGGARVVVEVIPDVVPPDITNHRQSSNRSTNIHVMFSENMDGSTFTNNTVNVTGSSSGFHSCTFDFDDSNYELQIDPLTDFVYGETVTVTIGTSVKDIAGNGLPNPYEFSFTIESIPAPQPTSLVVSATVNPNSNVAPFSTVNVDGTVYYNVDLNGDGQNDRVPVGTVTIDTGYDIYTKAVSDGNFNRNVRVADYDRYVHINATSEKPDGSGDLSGQAQVWVDIRGLETGQDYTFDRATTCQDVTNKNDPNAGNYPPIGETTWFRSDYTHVFAWVHLTDLYVPVRVKFEWYGPNGWFNHQDNPYISGWSKDPQDEDYLYWFDWWFWSSWTLSGTDLADMEGEWSVKIYVDNGNGWMHRETLKFYIRYDLTEHKTAKGVEGAPNFNPQTPTDVFTQSDTHVYTWMNLDNLAEDLDVKWEWIEPNGAPYDTFFAEPISQYDQSPGGFQPPFDWYRIWGYTQISGTPAANKCGKWEVRVFIKDAFGNYDHEYTDYFQIVESPRINPTVSVSIDPGSPVETQNITLNVNASDNTYLKKVTLYWNDGSTHSETWENFYSGSLNQSKVIDPYSAGQQVEYWAKAWDTSGNQHESEHYTIAIASAVVSAPNRPVGHAHRKVSETGIYTTGGSRTDLGQTVEYLFDWDDGEQSPWGEAAQNHSWINEGVYFVKAKARTKADTNMVSEWSSSFMVTVDSSHPIVTTVTNEGHDFTTLKSTIILAGTANDPEPASGLDSVTINTGNTNLGTLSDWSFRVDLTEGTNTLVVTAMDNAGNSSLDSITIVKVKDIDVSPPVSIEIVPPPGNIVLIPLNLTNPQAAVIDNFGLTVNYPDHLLQFQNCYNQTTLTESWDTITCQGSTPGEITINASNSTFTTATSGVLLNLVMQVLNQSGTGFIQLTNFSGDFSEASTSDGIVNSSVPVELVSFSAEVSENSVRLRWVTATETNNFGFEIAKSNDGSTFTKIGFVAGNGTTSESQIYIFHDRNLSPGTFYYRLKQIDTDGRFEYSSILTVEIDSPKNFVLYQNYPNPFNPETTIRFALPKPAPISLRIYDTLGKEIKTLVDGPYTAGNHKLHWDATNNQARPVASGVYFYEIRAGDFHQIRKMLLIR